MNLYSKHCRQFGRIDVVVNNAGYGMAGTVEETAEQDIRDIFNVNVLATIDVVKRVLPVMRGQQSGYIINIGSVAGFVGAPRRVGQCIRLPRLP